MDRLTSGMACIMAVAGSAFALPGDKLPRFESTPCDFGFPEGVRVDCGWLVVPVNRNRPTHGGTFRLAVAIFKSTEKTPAPDPIVFSTGGPGGSSILDSGGIWFKPLLARRDFIAVEHRGSRYSTPSLDCPEVKEVERTRVDDPLKQADRVVAAARLCRDRLLHEGADLSAYDSANIAADLIDLRKLLNIKKWNLYGVSYGARMMLTLMRADGSAVRSALLDSPLPPDVNWYETAITYQVKIFDKLMAECSADARCRRAFPNLKERFLRTVLQLDDAPAKVTLSDPNSGTRRIVEVSGQLLAMYVLDALGDESMLGLMPYILDRIAGGDVNAMAPLIPTGGASILSLGARYSIMCREQLPSHREEIIKAQSHAFPGVAQVATPWPVPRICKEWGAAPAASQEFLPVSSDAPALIFSGAHDSITPPSWGKRLTETLPNGTFIAFPGRCHGIAWSDADCAMAIAARFFDNPTSAPDRSCVAAMKGPLFVTPALGKSTAKLDVAPSSRAVNNTIQGARTLTEANRAEMALDVLSDLIRVAPGSADAHAALAEAYSCLAVQSLSRSLELDPKKLEGLNATRWALDGLEGRYRPMTPSVEVMKRIAGQYGPRHITFRNGKLYYQRGQGNEYELYALSGDLWGLKGASDFRLRIPFETDRAPAKLIVLYRSGREDVSRRDAQ